MKDKYTGSKESNELPLVLEYAYFSSDLITIHTSKKEKTIEKIRSNLWAWFENEQVKKMRNEKVDVAICLFICNAKYKNQDVDNIAKIVLDAISKRRKNDSGPYLLNNDNQVIRLLVYKQKSKDSELLQACTDQVNISIRKHNQKEQMILIQKKFI